MLRRMLPVLCAALATAVVPATAGAAPTNPAPATPTARYLVQLRPGADPAVEARALSAKGGDVRRLLHRAVRGMVADLTAAEAAALAADPDVLVVERDHVMRASVDQTAAPWGLDRVDQRALPLNGTYSYPSTAGSGVKVYVVDSGVRPTHSDLVGRVASGYAGVADGMGTQDCSGHGTHVAGIVAGTTYGVAKAATVVPVRVLDCLGTGSTSGIVAGLDWIVGVNAGAPAVVNISIGGPPSTVLDDAVRRLIAAGITVVVAAGNSAYNACLDSPARVTDAVTVGAVQSDDNRAQFSNVGPCVDLFAPGASIVSAGIAGDTATATKSGTSMAAPHVAGVAALVVSANPGISPANVALSLATNATVGAIPDPGLDSPNRLLFAATTAAATPLLIATSSMPTAQTGTAYSSTLVATGGTAPYTWGVSAGTLPAGITLSPTGVLSGTATVTGSWSFTARVADAKGQADTQALTLTVAAKTALPGAFGKSSPSNGATGRSRSSLTLSWGSSSGATSYQVCLDRVANGVCDTSWVSVGTATKWTTSNLLATTTYSWQVRALNAGGTTNANAGTWWAFTTSK